MRTATSALAIACIALSAPEPSAGEPAADFHVDSSRPDDYAGTRQDIESNLTDELAVKLRQFDEWAVEREQEAAAAAQAGGPSGGDADAADSTATPEADARADATSASRSRPHSARSVPVRTSATRPATTERRFPATYPQPPARTDKAPREDDVARMLREAAEQEDNPVRKQELMEQYEAYVRSL